MVWSYRGVERGVAARRPTRPSTAVTVALLLSDTPQDFLRADIARRYNELFALGWLGRAYLAAPPLFEKFFPAVFNFTPYVDSQCVNERNACFVTLMESCVVARGIPFHLKLDNDSGPSLLGIGCDLAAAPADAVQVDEGAAALCERINADGTMKRQIVRAVASTIFRRLNPVAKATRRGVDLEACGPPVAFVPRRDVWAREGSSEKWCQQVSGYYFAESTVQAVRFDASASEAQPVTFSFYFDQSEPINDPSAKLNEPTEFSNDPYRNVNPEVIYCAFDEDAPPPSSARETSSLWRRLRGGGGGDRVTLSRRAAWCLSMAHVASVVEHPRPAIAVAASSARRGVGYESDDGAFAFRLPNGWMITSACSPGRAACIGEGPGRRVAVRGAREGGGAMATATVDLGAYGKRLGEWATLEQARAQYESGWPPAKRLEMRCVSAVAQTSKGGTPRSYTLRFEGASSEAVRIVKLSVQQSRLYMLTLDVSRSTPDLEADIDAIGRSFEAFPVSSMRGGLLSSNEPAPLRPVEGLAAFAL